MQKIAFLGMLAFGLLTQTAWASDDVSPWSEGGFYAGLQAGYGNLNGKDNSGVSQTNESGLIGFFGGYDFAFDKVIVGFAVEGNMTNYRDLSASGASRSKDVWNSSGTVRIGYAINRFLPYLSAGVGVSEYSVKRISNGEVTSNVHFGYVLGAGLEAKITDNISARLDYKHSEMSRETYQFTGFSTFDIEGHQDAVTLGIAYHF